MKDDKKQATTTKSERSPKKLGSKLGPSKKLVQLDDAALQEVTGGEGGGVGTGIPNELP